MKSALASLALATLFCTFILAGEKSQLKDDPRVAKDNAVYVEPANKDADVAIVEEIQKWGRWRVVADETEAHIIVRLRASGSGAWGLGHIQAFILDAKTKETIWTSKNQKGTRNIFHGYASPFRRAAEGIVKQMKKVLGD